MCHIVMSLLTNIIYCCTYQYLNRTYLYLNLSLYYVIIFIFEEEYPSVNLCNYGQCFFDHNFSLRHNYVCHVFVYEI